MRVDTKWLIVGGIVAALVGAVVTGLFAIRTKQIPEPPAPVRPSQSKAVIQQPKSSETVGRTFVVSGDLGEMPEGYHVWLGIEIGALLWPKEPEIPIGDRHFSVKIVEGGNPPGGRFSLTLFQVSSEGQKRIADWVDTGRRTGDWPGLDPRDLNGFSQLDHADDLRLW